MIGTRRFDATTRRGALAVSGLALLVLQAAPAAAQQEERFTWTGSVEAGQTVEVKGVNGAVHADPADGPRVEVTALKTSRRGDPSSVRVEVVEHAGGVTLCAVYPTPGGQPANECRPGGGGRMNVRDSDVKVEFTVRVPDGVGFTGRTVNGGISALDLTGDVAATTVNGSVDVRTSGSASAETVNGGIEAVVGRAASGGTLRFQTVNGSIRLQLPADAGARVRAETVNGRLETDFPLTIQGGAPAGPRRIEGTIGAGGATLELRTVNGTIALRREG